MASSTHSGRNDSRNENLAWCDRVIGDFPSRVANSSSLDAMCRDNGCLRLDAAGAQTLGFNTNVGSAVTMMESIDYGAACLAIRLCLEVCRSVPGGVRRSPDVPISNLALDDQIVLCTGRAGKTILLPPVTCQHGFATRGKCSRRAEIGRSRATEYNSYANWTVCTCRDNCIM